MDNKDGATELPSTVGVQPAGASGIPNADDSYKEATAIRIGCKVCSLLCSYLSSARYRIPDEVLVMVHNGKASRYHLTARVTNILADPAYSIPYEFRPIDSEMVDAFRVHWNSVNNSVKGKNAWAKHAYSVVEEHVTNLVKKYYALTYEQAIREIDLSPGGIFSKADLLGYKLTGTQSQDISTKMNDLLRNNCEKPKEVKPNDQPALQYVNPYFSTSSTISSESILDLLTKMKGPLGTLKIGEDYGEE